MKPGRQSKNQRLGDAGGRWAVIAALVFLWGLVASITLGITQSASVTFIVDGMMKSRSGAT